MDTMQNGNEGRNLCGRKFGFLKAVKMASVVFWVVTSCSLNTWYGFPVRMKDIRLSESW
jgi:hypothetical protein